MAQVVWGGRKVMLAREQVAKWLPMKCGRCPRMVDGSEPWVIGHKISRNVRPDLMWDVANWQPEHKACSDASSNEAKYEKARVQSANTPNVPVFPSGDPQRNPGHLPISPSESMGEPIKIRPELLWDRDVLEQYEWLRPLLDIPEDASPPLWMSLPPDDVVGSYGESAIKWIEGTQNITLRWWQKLAITRQLEVRQDGTLPHREILESAPRRAGKSLRLRGMALWRMEHGPMLFNETQLIMHTGSDMNICREIQRGAWRWSEDVAKWKVTRANGKEAIETKAGDRWLVRAQDAVYGYDVTLGAVDEAWDVKPDTVSEGLEPATLERSSPQLHLTSTAHRRATSLMRGRLSAALSSDDPSTLILVWAAPYGSNPADPEVWRKASPHWTEDRRKLIASKYAKALAGEDDPEFDDPDPMEGFKAQYLNMWRLVERKTTKGNAITEAQAWGDLGTLPPDETPGAAAIESWFSDGYSVALAWRVDGRAVVSVTDHSDLTSAAELIRESGYRGQTIVGSSLMDDPALSNLPRRKGEGRVANAAADLDRLIREDGIRHDGTSHLTEQVLAIRTQQGVDGARVISANRADAIKAAVWAAGVVRKKGKSGKVRILLPSV